MSGIAFATTPRKAEATIKLVSEEGFEEIPLTDDIPIRRQSLEERDTL
jgi:hypothetical protein